MPCLKPPKREGECAPSVRKGRCWVALHWAGTARATSPLDGDARTCTTEPEETKHPILQRRYLFSERSVVRGWQDSRAVHDSRGLRSERSPLPGRIFAPCVPERRFAGLFGCMARISCQSQPVFGCMARESCRELAIFPSEATFGMHEAQNLPRIAARERISRAFCHRQAPENAPWRRGGGRCRANGTSANSTPRADTSKKP